MPYSDPRLTLRDNVRALCKRKYGVDQSVRRLAVDSGVTPSTINRIYKATTAIGIDKLPPIAQAFGVSPAALLQKNLGAEGLSVMATQLGEELDQIADLSLRRTVWALCMLVVSRRELPNPNSAPAVAPMPTAKARRQTRSE